MRESEFKIEWLYSNLRWFFLMAVTAVLGVETSVSEGVFSGTVLALLITGTIGNLLVMLLLAINAFRKPMSLFTMILDVALTLGLIASTGGPDSILLFVSFIPIITTALRYTWLVSLSVVLGTVFVYWWSTWTGLEFSFNMPLVEIWRQSQVQISSGLVLLLAGGGVSWVGAKIKEMLVAEQQQQEENTRGALDAAHQKVRLIFELASTLSATLNYERVLEAALDVSQAGLRELLAQDIAQVQLILLFGMDESLYVASSRGLTLQDKRARFAVQSGMLAQALEKAEPVIADEPGADPELGQLVAMHQCRQVIVVPLRAGFESYGAMIMASPVPGIYNNDFRDLLEAVCNQAIMALQNARLYQNLMEEKERLVAVEEDARKKLARDLHDGPTQTIAAIAMRLNYIQMLIESRPEEARKEVAQLEDMSRRTTKEIRQMLFTLRPLILESQGVAAALTQYQSKLAETDTTPIHLELEEDIDTHLDKGSQGAIFYIVEEALTNARKHAEATDLWVRLYKRGMNVIAEIEDNGKGFDVADVEEGYALRGSLGMRNLRERATLVGGKTVIHSKPGEGTRIIVTIPIKGEPYLHVR